MRREEHQSGWLLCLIAVPEGPVREGTCYEKVCYERVQILRQDKGVMRLCKCDERLCDVRVCFERVCERLYHTRRDSRKGSKRPTCHSCRPSEVHGKFS